MRDASLLAATLCALAGATVLTLAPDETAALVALALAALAATLSFAALLALGLDLATRRSRAPRPPTRPAACLPSRPLPTRFVHDDGRAGKRVAPRQDVA